MTVSTPSRIVRVRDSERRPAWRALLALFLLVLLSSPAIRAATTADLLSVDKAFQPSVHRQGDRGLVARWQIADGYYLYRHALEFSLNNAAGVTLDTVHIPPGDKHDDEYFGPVETYRHTLRVPITLQDTLPDSATLTVHYQGCADAGLCYPPQTRTLTIAAAPRTGANAGPPAIPTQAHPTQAMARPAGVDGVDTSQTVSLADRLAHAPALTTLGLFLLLGLGLAFTPCILPMIPIVAGLIGSRAVSRSRGVALTLSYVLAMAAAYTVFGLAAGYFGANLQAALQRPLVLLPFAGLFGLLGAASFGWFDFQIPGALQTRLTRAGPRRSGLLGAAGLGFASALIAGPCLAPPLAGALLYISASGDYLLGGAALFCLGLGMGLPLIALAVFGLQALPRAGAWMQEIRVFFGVLLIAVGLWLALRLAAAELALAAWGTLTLVYGSYLSTRSTTQVPARVCQRLVVAVLGLYAGLAAAGLAIGHGRPTAPLAGLSLSQSARPVPAATDALFQRVTTRQGLDRALTRARAAGQPAIVDFYADWCVECVDMKHTLFRKPQIIAALSDLAVIEFDVTAYDSNQRRAMQSMSVFGPPTLLFYDRRGQRVPAATRVGRIDAKALMQSLQQIEPTG